MSFTVYLAMYGWPLVALYLFMVLPARRAVIAAITGAWLFLPVASFSFKGLPDYDKAFACSIGALLGAVLFDREDRVWSFRPRWFDLPMLVWCLSPFASSLANDLGAYDGLSSALQQTISWGIPYFLGRVYFTDREGIKLLAIGLFVGGLIYVPFCLYEIRMSPQLHDTVYGFRQHSFAQTRRGDGWRPMVFLGHGLAVGMWMANATLLGLVIWRTGVVKQLQGVSVGFLWLVQLAATVLCKSTGSLVLLAGGVAVFLTTQWTRTRLWSFALLATVPVYLYCRIEMGWHGEELVAWAEKISPQRAQSFKYRLDAEVLLLGRALESPAFGWGGHSRSRVLSETGKDVVATDSRWIVEFGKHGLLGLFGFAGSLLLPVALVLRRLPARRWGAPEAAIVAGSALALNLYALDQLVNGMPNPMFLLLAGGLSTVAGVEGGQALKALQEPVSPAPVEVKHGAI
jgi:hypothetical protein